MAKPVDPATTVLDLIDYIEETLCESYYDEQSLANVLEYTRDQLEVLLEQIESDSD